MGRAGGFARIGGGGAFAQLERLARNPGPLSRGREVEQGDLHAPSSSSSGRTDVARPSLSSTSCTAPAEAHCLGAPGFLECARAMAAAGHNLGTVELLALLRDGSLKPDSIAEEMACAGPHPCTAAQIAEARELLGLLQQERTAQSAGLAAEGAAAEPEVARRISSLP